MDGCGSTAKTSGPTVWSHDLAMPGDEPRPWMMKLARMLILKDLPMGVIVGSAVIEKCEKIEDGESRIEAGADVQSSRSSILYPQSSMYRWHLGGIERAKKLCKPKGHPQPVWFTPF